MHLSDRAYTQLKRLILSRPADAGEALSERGLASQMSMSRVPVREAIKALESEGILVVLPRRGIHVRRLTIEQVRELYEIREALEGMAARLCGERSSGATIRACRLKLEKLAQARPIDHAGIQHSSATFHRMLFKLCGNAQLRAMYMAIEPQIALNHRLTALHALDRIEQALHEHIAVAKAIEAGDARRAERLTRRHMKNGKRARIRILRALARERAEKGLS